MYGGDSDTVTGSFCLKRGLSLVKYRSNISVAEDVHLSKQV